MNMTHDANPYITLLLGAGISLFSSVITLLINHTLQENKERKKTLARIFSEAFAIKNGIYGYLNASINHRIQNLYINNLINLDIPDKKELFEQLRLEQSLYNEYNKLAIDSTVEFQKKIAEYQGTFGFDPDIENLIIKMAGDRIFFDIEDFILQNTKEKAKQERDKVTLLTKEKVSCFFKNYIEVILEIVKRKMAQISTKCSIRHKILGLIKPKGAIKG